MSKKSDKEMKKAHERTDKTLHRSEQWINSYYNRHSRAVIRIFNAFYKRHKKEFDQKLTEYKNGEITKEEYRVYMLNQTVFSNDWKKTVDKLTETLTDINQNALHQIVNENLGEIYLDNYNTTIKAIGGELLEDWI